MATVFTPGSIVWVTAPDSLGGNPKSRPCIVVSTEEEQSDGFVRAVALTTLTGLARFDETVLIPDSPTVQSLTNLKRECEAVCTWVVRVPIADVGPVEGRLPSTLLAEILDKVERYN